MDTETQTEEIDLAKVRENLAHGDIDWLAGLYNCKPQYVSMLLGGTRPAKSNLAKSVVKACHAVADARERFKTEMESQIKAIQ